MSEDQLLMKAFIEGRMEVNVYYPVNSIKAQRIITELIALNIPSLWRLEFSNDYTKVRLFDFEMLPGTEYNTRIKIGFYSKRAKNERS